MIFNHLISNWHLLLIKCICFQENSPVGFKKKFWYLFLQRSYLSQYTRVFKVCKVVFMSRSSCSFPRIIFSCFRSIFHEWVRIWKKLYALELFLILYETPSSIIFHMKILTPTILQDFLCEIMNNYESRFLFWKLSLMIFLVTY